MSTPSALREFKIVILGSAGVGKTSYITRLKTKDFTVAYTPTTKVDVSCLQFPTSSCDVIFNIWDFGGQERFDPKIMGNTQDCYYVGAHAAIIMFDVTNFHSYREVSYWFDEIRKVCPSVPIVICGNKAESKQRKVKDTDIVFHRRHNLQYYDLSVKSYNNFEKPILYLIRKLLTDNSVIFRESCPMAPEGIPSCKKEQ